MRRSPLPRPPALLSCSRRSVNQSFDMLALPHTLPSASMRSRDQCLLFPNAFSCTCNLAPAAPLAPRLCTSSLSVFQTSAPPSNCTQFHCMPKPILFWPPIVTAVDKMCQNRRPRHPPPAAAQAVAAAGTQPGWSTRVACRRLGCRLPAGCEKLGSTCHRLIPRHLHVVMLGPLRCAEVGPSHAIIDTVPPTPTLVEDTLFGPFVQPLQAGVNGRVILHLLLGLVQASFASRAAPHPKGALHIKLCAGAGVVRRVLAAPQLAPHAARSPGSLAHVGGRSRHGGSQRQPAGAASRGCAGGGGSVGSSTLGRGGLAAVCCPGRGAGRRHRPR